MGALAKGLLRRCQHSQLFVHDNAGIHRSKVVAAYLEEHKLTSATSNGQLTHLTEHLW
jgi:hypothetical protein